MRRHVANSLIRAFRRMNGSSFYEAHALVERCASVGLIKTRRALPGSAVFLRRVLAGGLRLRVLFCLPSSLSLAIDHVFLIAAAEARRRRHRCDKLGKGNRHGDHSGGGFGSVEHCRLAARINAAACFEANRRCKNGEMDHPRRRSHLSPHRGSCPNLWCRRDPPAADITFLANQDTMPPCGDPPDRTAVIGISDADG